MDIISNIGLGEIFAGASIVLLLVSGMALAGIFYIHCIGIRHPVVDTKFKVPDAEKTG